MAQPNRTRRARPPVATPSRAGGRRARRAAGLRSPALVAALVAATTAACQPTVKVEAPKEPITINLNIQADVRVKLEERAREDVEANPDVF